MIIPAILLGSNSFEGVGVYIGARRGQDLRVYRQNPKSTIFTTMIITVIMRQCITILSIYVTKIITKWNEEIEGYTGTAAKERLKIKKHSRDIETF